MTTPLIILLLLTAPLITAFIVSTTKGAELCVGKFSCWGLGIVFIFFSLGHVVKAEGMIEMLPAWVPLRLPIIYLTGVLELIIGIALFFPKYQINAAKAAVLVFIIFFPANIYAAINGVGLGGHKWGAIYLLIRLPLQITLIAWAYYLCIKNHKKSIQPTAKASAD